MRTKVMLRTRVRIALLIYRRIERSQSICMYYYYYYYYELFIIMSFTAIMTYNSACKHSGMMDVRMTDRLLRLNGSS